jgi:hypothetical protein
MVKQTNFNEKKNVNKLTEGSALQCLLQDVMFNLFLMNA